MQPACFAPNHALFARAWRQFTTRRALARDLDPLVARSWQRSAPRLNPRAAPQWSYLGKAALARTREKHAALLALARPLMEDIYQFIEGTGAYIGLTDKSHCLLEELGDRNISRALHGLGIRPGVFLDESRAGTNGFAVALTESAPAQIVGAEHFLAVFHSYSSIAAPVFDLDGSLVGAVGVMQRVNHYTPHVLGIVVAAARAIENQLSAEFLMREANERASELNAALEAISDGVLAWNAQGIVTHLNEQGGALLGLAPNLVVGRNWNEYLTLPEPLARAVALGEEVREAEIGFQSAGKTRECFVSLRVLKDSDGAPIQFIATLRRVEQVRQLVTRMVGAHARLTLDDFVGNSLAARRVRKQALTAANAKGSVLLLGEAGTSKNALARAIHNSSKRAAGPFLAINCRAIPRDLALSEFLGFEAGAAAGGQSSKFELANGGTLFLDQVDALPLDMQTALVRVIEFGEVIRLGGTRVIAVDVRVMASSEAALEQRVKELSFRRDLYYRLSPIVIQLPPLRERPEDIAGLTARLLEKSSRQVGRALRIAPAALQRLERYPFPGNITELEVIIERAALYSEGEIIRVEHLPPDVRERRVYAMRKGAAEPVRSMAESEAAAILAAGRAARGNLSETARTLGIGRSTLWRKMKMLGIGVTDLRVE
jgi:transcriptional activator for dhaKLM operon